MAILHDERMTAVHATVSPIWDSPLRLCDREAWDALESKWGPVRHTFLGGHFGPNFNRQALKAGRSWEELQQFAANVSDGVFISRNLEALRQRGVDMLFHPGTHDFVAYDLAWGGAHHPDIPVFLAANTGHGIKSPHPENYPGQANRDVFLLEHFFDEVEPLLTAPTIETEIKGSMLEVSVTFPANSGEESGRLWWMFDRPMDGSPGYLEKRFPDENWAEMEKDPPTGSWRAVIPLDDAAATVDFFSTHRKTIRYQDRDYNNSLSSPYTRVNYGKSTGLSR